MGQRGKVTCSEVTTEVSPGVVEGSGSGIALQKCPTLRAGNRALTSLRHPVTASRLSHGGVGRGGECFLGQGSSLWQRAVPFEGHICAPSAAEMLLEAKGMGTQTLTRGPGCGARDPPHHSCLLLLGELISLIGESCSEFSRIHICHLACIFGFWCLA